VTTDEPTSHHFILTHDIAIHGQHKQKLITCDQITRSDDSNNGEEILTNYDNNAKIKMPKMYLITSGNKLKWCKL